DVEKLPARVRRRELDRNRPRLDDSTKPGDGDLDVRLGVADERSGIELRRRTHRQIRALPFRRWGCQTKRFEAASKKMKSAHAAEKNSRSAPPSSRPKSALRQARCAMLRTVLANRRRNGEQN